MNMSNHAMAEYSVQEINGVLETMRAEYDLVRLVDSDECRILNVDPDGNLRYASECFRIWGVNSRCSNCSSYQACMTHRPRSKTEVSGEDKFLVESIPILLKLKDDELEACVIERINIRKLSDAEKKQERKKVKDNLDYLNTHDMLTQLYNRQELIRRIRQRLMDSDETHLLITGDVLNFRLINSLFGYDRGNDVLMGIADILRATCTHNEIYGRLEGDHFLIFVEKRQFDEKLFLRRLRKIHSLIDSPIYTLQTHLGVYEVTNRDMPVTLMIEHADLALNSIKRKRNHRIAYYVEGMMETHIEEQLILSEFEANLNAGQFHIYLQPQVDEKGRVKGAETLVRWIRPDGSVVPPGKFLSVLERSELISTMDLHIWELAVKQLAKWRNTEFHDLYLSVNIDPKDFYYADVPEALSELCDRYGVNRAMLRVELTENALVEDIEKQGRVVEKLQEAGFIVEIDDFGKGSSSLSMLKDVHADVLKIDMGFLAGTNNQHRSSVILESVIDMAEQLHMDVVTEGVETKQQVQQLTEMGCRIFQGYYFSRPVSVDHFETMFRGTLEREKQ